MPYVLLAISGIFTFIGFLGKYGYWFDLTSHFRLQYLIFQILCIVLCIPKKRWKLLSILILPVVLNAALILPFYFTSNALLGKTIKDQEISLILLNLNSSNHEYDKVLEYINRLDPDIVALEELNDQWLAALSPLLEEYSYKKIKTREDNFGIGLFSKVPLDEINIQYFGSAGVPSILAKFKLGEKPISLLFTHPVPPANHQYFNWRNEQLNVIASNRHKLGSNLILLGDLNLTSWSYYFAKLQKRMDIRDSRKGFGLQNSWPASIPMASIAIDHCLISKEFDVLKREVGPNIGSDHYPVYLELAI